MGVHEIDRGLGSDRDGRKRPQLAQSVQGRAGADDSRVPTLAVPAAWAGQP